MFCDGSTANVGFEVVGTVVKVGSHVDRFAENDQVRARTAAFCCCRSRCAGHAPRQRVFRPASFARLPPLPAQKTGASVQA